MWEGGFWWGVIFYKWGSSMGESFDGGMIYGGSFGLGQSFAGGSFVRDLLQMGVFCIRDLSLWDLLWGIFWLGGNLAQVFCGRRDLLCGDFPTFVG